MNQHTNADFTLLWMEKLTTYSTVDNYPSIWLSLNRVHRVNNLASVL